MAQGENIRLEPIMETAPVPFTMDTIGWEIVFLILLGAMAYLVNKYYQHYRNNKYRREAILKISDIGQKNTNSISSMITQIMFHLKQTALKTYDRKTVASLEGKRWLQFLDEKVKGSYFLNVREVIVNAIYKDEYDKNGDFNKSDFVKMSIKWIKDHA